MGLLLVGTFCSRFELSVAVESNDAKFLFDTTTDLPLFSGRETVSALRRDPHQIHCKDTASQIPMKDGVRQSVTFENGHCVQYTVTRIHHNARRPSRSRQKQDRLGRHVRGGRFQCVKHGLRHALSVSPPIHTGVLSLWWSKHLDLQCGWRQRRQFFRHVLKDPLEHGRCHLAT